MIIFEDFSTYGWKTAILGMRNPYDSWEKSDSDIDNFGTGYIGEEDMKLMQRLAKGGSVHAKYRRFITVYMTITAPLYWWKEFDTYKIGTAANSCSTMHTLMERDFKMEDFSVEHLGVCGKSEDGEQFYQSLWPTRMQELIRALNYARSYYIHEKDPEVRKQYWWQVVQLLPSSYNQKRTVLLNYEVLANIAASRKGHKLDEWHDFLDFVKGMPYSDELIFGIPMDLVVKE